MGKVEEAAAWVFTYNTMIRVERMVLVQEDVLIFSRGISDVHVPRPAAT